MRRPDSQRPRQPRRLTTMTALALACLLPVGACSSSHKDSGVSGSGAFAGIDPDAPSRPEYKLGYMLQWQGFPRITSRKGAHFFDVLGDTVVVQDYDQHLTVMEAASGRNRWAALVGEKLDKFIGNARSGDKLIVSSDTEVQIYDVKTGDIASRQRLATLCNTRPVIVGSLAIYGGASGEVLAHNMLVGYKAWGYQLKGSIRANPVLLADQDVGAVSQAGDVIIVDGERGAAQGRRGEIFSGLDNNPVGDARGLYVASLDQSIYAFSRIDGKRLWRYRTEAPIEAQPALHDGILYVYVPREGLIALDTRSGERLWANETVKGDVVAMRKGHLVVWDGKAFTTLDPERGEVLDTIPFPDVQKLIFDVFEDGNMYTISRKGKVEKYAPAF